MKNTARIYFYKCIIDVQKSNPENSFLSARIFFSVTALYHNAPKGQNVVGFDTVCVAQQPHGENYFDNPLEVVLTADMRGVRLPHNPFSDAVEEYLRELVGRNDELLSISGPSFNLKDVGFKFPKTVTLDLVDTGGGW
ncbi:hypothetical protein [Dyadobacter chenhuakuii]|uniref:Uncharacterized protein n=1 Tax=Dyadobacter chenhuakuii TaxID=2909339 RepID=A0A9X1U0K5_9BACT|nr:hypothetical protein [Dyadobacter chenhuakuii]MCF2498356.1 hypothetical protein [Dyadobacter chenhuakuii]